MNRVRSSASRLQALAALFVAAATALVAQQSTSSSAPVNIANVGFKTPESVLHDAQADAYLVSNINGVPSAKDNNGFISRVSPDGTVAVLKWIEGGVKGVTLNAPKGLAVHGDTLYVSDIDCVRRFNRTSGAAAGETCVQGATFLNDVTVDSKGIVYVTDTGIRIDEKGATPTGTDAVYRVTSDGRAIPVIKTTELQRPNGIVAAPDGLIVVQFGGAEVFHLDGQGARHAIGTLPSGQLDGVVRLSDGTLLISSWEGKAVYRRSKAGTASPLMQNVSSPADIGYDATRKRLLVPVFTEDRVIVQQIT
jgi:sugar lactone lactonase YvrE